MGWAYSYCRKCDAGLTRATLEQVIDGSQFCGNGHSNPPNRTHDEVLLDLVSKVEQLEAEVDLLKIINEIG